MKSIYVCIKQKRQKYRCGNDGRKILIIICIDRFPLVFSIVSSDPSIYQIYIYIYIIYCIYIYIYIYLCGLYNYNLFSIGIKKEKGEQCT